jgi:putative transposase
MNIEKSKGWSNTPHAIYYINKTGVQWAYLPHDFPPYTTVNYHYIKFVKSGLFERINDHLREVARETSTLKKNAAPSVGIIDFQSVETKGLEVGKLVKGRKRSIVVDTMGYVICVFVHAANIYGCGATHQMEKQEKFYLIKYLKNIT